jgi:hypothetical protein
MSHSAHRAFHFNRRDGRCVASAGFKIIFIRFDINMAEPALSAPPAVAVLASTKPPLAPKMKANWTEALQQNLVDACMSVVESGAYADNGFKSSEWKAIVDHFQSGSGFHYSKDQLQSQLNELKKKFVAFKTLKMNSGFGWNNGIPTCPSAVWAAVIAANKDCKQFKNAGFHFYDDLGIIFAGKLATGEFASSSLPAPPGETGYSSDSTHNTLDPLNTSEISGYATSQRDATAGASPPRKVARGNPAKDAANALAAVLDLLKKPTAFVKEALQIFDALKTQMGLTSFQSMKFKKCLADHSEYAEYFTGMTAEEQAAFVAEITGAVYIDGVIEAVEGMED